MSSLKHLLEYNRYQNEGVKANDCLNVTQGLVELSPKYLWIDCVDNYCTPNEIIGVPVNEIIVYKNLAHQVHYTDLNCLSVLQYAIQMLGIQHIIICGHYNCSVLRQSTRNIQTDLVGDWLQSVYSLYQKYEQQLGLYRLESVQRDKLCELNVIEQVLRLCKTTVVQNTWAQKKELTIHGWAYSADKGLLNNLTPEIAGEHDISPAFHAAITECLGKS